MGETFFGDLFFDDFPFFDLLLADALFCVFPFREASFDFFFDGASGICANITFSLDLEKFFFEVGVFCDDILLG